MNCAFYIFSNLQVHSTGFDISHHMITAHFLHKAERLQKCPYVGNKPTFTIHIVVVHTTVAKSRLNCYAISVEQ